jgi:hypothetical protein
VIWGLLCDSTIGGEKVVYTDRNFQTGKELKEAFAKGDKLSVYQPGGMFSPTVNDGDHTVEGPHYPKPHKFYVRVRVKDGIITAILK